MKASSLCKFIKMFIFEDFLLKQEAHFKSHSLLYSFIQTKMSALEKIKTRLDKETESLNMLDLSEIPITNISEEIKKVLERFKKVKVLILKHCDLDSLENLPNWKLTAIDLSQNRFKDNIISKLITIPSLTQILLMENQLQSLDRLKQLSCLKHLQEVDFTGNPVASEHNYRPILFDSIKSLEIVDQRDLNGQFAAEEQQEDDGSEFNQDDGYASEQEEYEEEEDQQSSQKPKKGGRRK